MGHTIEDGVEAKAPHGGLVGVAVADILLVALVVLALLLVILLLVITLVLVLVLVLMLVFMFMLVTSVAVGVSEAAVSQRVGEHHHGKTDSDANTDQAVGVHLGLLRLHLSDILKSVGNRFGDDSRKGGTDHQTRAQSTDNRESSLSNAQPIGKVTKQACPKEKQNTKESDERDRHLVLPKQRCDQFKHGSRSYLRESDYRGY